MMRKIKKIKNKRNILIEEYLCNLYFFLNTSSIKGLTELHDAGGGDGPQSFKKNLYIS